MEQPQEDLGGPWKDLVKTWEVHGRISPEEVMGPSQLRHPSTWNCLTTWVNYSPEGRQEGEDQDQELSHAHAGAPGHTHAYAHTSGHAHDGVTAHPVIKQGNKYCEMEQSPYRFRSLCYL